MVIQLWRITRGITAAAAYALHQRRVRALVAVALAITAGAALLSTLGGEPPRTAHADHGGAHLEPLARGQFGDDVSALLMVRLEGSHPMRVIHVNEASDAIAAKLTVPPGASVDWHTHPGAAIALVAQGELTITFARDCQPRVYPAGSALVHGAEGLPDLAENRGEVDVVMYVTFLGNPPGPATVPADDPGC